jgi:hypothetical protein
VQELSGLLLECLYSMGHMKRVNLRSLLVSFSSICLVAVVGCQPRGESHTLEQILSDARSNYSLVSAEPSPEVGAFLNQLKANLDKLAGLGGGGDARDLAGEVAGILGELTQKAGFTARPAMTELMNQYKVIADGTGSPVSIGAPNLQLLAARTFSLLTAELSTSKFSL